MSVETVARDARDAGEHGLEAAKQAAASLASTRAWASWVYLPRADQVAAHLQRADTLAYLRDHPPAWPRHLPAWTHKHACAAWHEHLDHRARWYREGARQLLENVSVG